MTIFELFIGDSASAIRVPGVSDDTTISDNHVAVNRRVENFMLVQHGNRGVIGKAEARYSQSVRSAADARSKRLYALNW
ncbi:hypothetical protein RRF57_005785 [Xylaria bambusicola]|uniref:Uncharacterized protein n=1 Tax=Xylaria bambusicola TaxID=326684 RepID=A0AAN7UMQ6_9PEZI